MEYEIGDMIVYPRRGAGTITGVERMELVEGHRQYYVIDIPTGRLTVRVPSEKVDELGLRPVVTESRLDALLDMLGREPVILPDNYKERQTGVREQLATGSAVPIVEVIRDLCGHEQRRYLTKVDRDLLAEGRGYLASEFALILDRDVLDVQKLIDEALEPANETEDAD